MNEKNSIRRLLLSNLDSVFFGEAWHGAALLPTVRAFDFTSVMRENAEGYSPWKVTLHCAYWKFAVRRMLILEGDAPVFPRSPEDFPSLPTERNETAWKADIAFLENEHAMLRSVVDEFPEDRFDEVAPYGTYTYAGLVLGAAEHDTYHTAHLRNLGIRSF